MVMKKWKELKKWKRILLAILGSVFFLWLISFIATLLYIKEPKIEDYIRKYVVESNGSKDLQEGMVIWFHTSNRDEEDLILIKNSFYARHGFVFHDNPEIQQFFANQAWFSPRNTDKALTKDEVYETFLTELDKKNINYINSLLTNRIVDNKLNEIKGLAQQDPLLINLYEELAEELLSQDSLSATNRKEAANYFGKASTVAADNDDLDAMILNLGRQAGLYNTSSQTKPAYTSEDDNSTIQSPHKQPDTKKVEGTTSVKQNLYKADIRQILIKDNNIEDFSGDVKFMMPKRKFLQVYNSRNKSETANDEKYSFEIFEQNPSGLISFAFNKDDLLFQVQMAASFENKVEVSNHFNKTKSFFENLLGKSLSLKQLAEKLSVSTPNNSSHEEYGTWFTENLIVIVQYEKKENRNGQVYYWLELVIEELTD